MLLIVAVYIGYNASQDTLEDTECHSIPIDLKILETSPELLHIIEKQDDTNQLFDYLTILD